jgi:hypothetical protein
MFLFQLLASNITLTPVPNKDVMKHSKVLFLICAALCLAACKERETAFDYHFHEVLITPDIPSDVDTMLLKTLHPETSLDTANWSNLAKIKRMFNIYSWQSLLAINWPTDDQGNPLPDFTSNGNPEWMQWKEAYEVFRCGGEVPTPWGAERIVPCADSSLLLRMGNSISRTSIKDKRTRILYLTNKNFANETTQAFTSGLKDKNGNLVYYEILMNREEYDYIGQNSLYNLDGQIAYANKSPDSITPASFPSGIYNTPQKGAIEIKLAWRVLDPAKGDDPSRYITADSYIPDAAGSNFTMKKVGLVGFHIAQNPTSCQQWVWSTFEHVDNLNTNTIDAAVAGQKLTRPSFYKDYDPTHITNTAKYNGNGTSDTALSFTQCQRRISIPNDVAALNREVRGMLKDMGSAWQYYELIDTQFPTNPAIAPTVYDPAKNNTAESIINVSGGRPTPAYLTNITMESYFQVGNQRADSLIKFIGSTTKVFGTQSCIGCHSSAAICIGNNAGIPKWGPPLSGDFSWLLNKARWKEK